MILNKNPQFFEECSKYSLTCSCQECIHFNEQTGKCSLGWPNGNHLAENIKSKEEPLLIFCKEFDLK